ncbi:MAG: response regulator [Proteobacteria bacterium]|nr:response regulator [Pseudomonadota bacterium]
MDAFPRRLVVIDDDDHLLQSMRFAFEAEGYLVTTFASGEEALKAPPRDPHTCLVVDARLPGTSGLDTIAQLRRLGVAAPAILITTNPSQAERRRAGATGVSIVEKPLLGDALGKTIAALLGS